MTVLDGLEHRRKLLVSFSRFRLARIQLGCSPFIRPHSTNLRNVDDTNTKNRVYCFLVPEIQGACNTKLSRIVIELYTRDCPATCENFRLLCTGERGYGYCGTVFHRIEPEFVVQAGKVGRSVFGGKATRISEDFSSSENNTGTSSSTSTSITGGFFPDENFGVKHDSMYDVSMANPGERNRNRDEFFITCCPHDASNALDGKFVKFGKVVRGFDSVHAIEAAKVNNQSVVISECGQLKSLPAEAEIRTALLSSDVAEVRVDVQ